MKVIADRWSYGMRPRFHAVDFEEVSAEIQAKTETRYWQVILKRMMYRAADAVAHDAARSRSSPAKRSVRSRPRRCRTWR